MSLPIDIPDDVFKYEDESCILDVDDTFIPATDESSFSSKDEYVNAGSKCR